MGVAPDPGSSPSVYKAAVWQGPEFLRAAAGACAPEGRRPGHSGSFAIGNREANKRPDIQVE